VGAVGKASCQVKGVTKVTNDNMRIVINALTAEPATIQWQFPCNDDQEMHTNFAFYWSPVNWRDHTPNHGWLVWHNCLNDREYKSPLTSCCSCHSGESFPAEGPPVQWCGAAYFGCELTDSEAMENKITAWAIARNLIQAA
jgi:hypothetical protein